MPELSVIVCTHERERDLERCLQALRQLHDPVEVVVVDSGSRQPCERLVRRYVDRIACLRYVYVEQPGLSRARNAGLAAATADIVAFVDDDAAPRPDWGTALRRAFAAREVGCVGGACAPRFESQRPGWLSDRLLQLAGITRFGEHGREPRTSAEWPFGANMAFRRNVLEQVGPFSTALGRTGRSLLSGEDSDMVSRVLAAGWRVWLEPAAVVDHTVHLERCVPAYYWRRLWWNGVGRAFTPAAGVGLRLAVAAPVRLVLWAACRDRLYLYRLAETAGYFATRLRLFRPVGRATSAEV